MYKQRNQHIEIKLQNFILFLFFFKKPAEIHYRNQTNKVYNMYIQSCIIKNK